MTLATRLGFLDVDAMLDAMTPEQFLERWAGIEIDDRQQWRKVGTLAAEAHNAGLMAMAAQGGEIKDDQIREAADYEPGAELRQTARTLTAEESWERAKAKYGHNDNPHPRL